MFFKSRGADKTPGDKINTRMCDLAEFKFIGDIMHVLGTSK